MRAPVRALDGTLVGSVPDPDTEPLTDEELEFFGAILGVPGIIGFQATRYCLLIRRANMFSWKTIVPRVVALMRDYLDPAGEVREVKPPKPRKRTKARPGADDGAAAIPHIIDQIMRAMGGDVAHYRIMPVDPPEGPE